MGGLQTAAVLKRKCCFVIGEMAERLNAPVLKTGVGLRPPGVQIPLSPPMGNGVMAARENLDLLVRVRVLVPQQM